MKTLLLDVETSPLTVYCWGLREQDISLDQIIDTSFVLCWSAKWLGSDDIMFERTWKRKGSSKQMIQRIHSLLSEADTVVTFNGQKFDLPVLSKEFIMHGLGQPAPYANLDLLKVARSRFRFASNKLQHLSTELGLGTKTPHEGFMLWVKCMDLDKDAWDAMTTYNKQDVLLLEKLYYRLLPWLKHAPNQSVVSGTACCPNCGSLQHQKRGFAYTTAGRFQRYQCTACGSWYRAVENLAKGQKRTVAL
jgi:hypothetical protein